MKSLVAIPTATLAFLLGGCAPKSENGKAEDPPLDSPNRIVMPSPDELRERLTGTNNGLEVRRWTVVDAGNASLGVIDNHSEGAATDEATTERLRQNGLRFVRVPVANLDLIVGDLGGATIDRNEWHGQVVEWRSLREQMIDGRGIAVAVDGRVRRFDRGEFRLLVRSWTVMMEDGPHMHVEVLPQHRLPPSNNMRRLLGEKLEDVGEPFTSLALDLQLQAGYAYVLVSESPNIDWARMDAPAPLVAAAAQERAPTEHSAHPANPPAADATAPRVRVGPDDSAGPEAGAPRTLGEVLLPAFNNPPSREILVFVPRLPEELFPPIYESDLNARRGGDAARSGAASNGNSGGAGQ